MVLRGQDAWRRHPIFKWGIFDALPGLREGAAAFGLYLAGDWVYHAFFAPIGGEGHGHHHHDGGHHGPGAHGLDAAAEAAAAGSHGAAAATGHAQLK